MIISCFPMGFPHLSVPHPWSTPAQSHRDSDPIFAAPVNRAAGDDEMINELCWSYSNSYRVEWLYINTTRILANTSNIHQYSQFWCLKKQIVVPCCFNFCYYQSFPNRAGASVIAACSLKPFETDGYSGNCRILEYPGGITSKPPSTPPSRREKKQTAPGRAVGSGTTRHRIDMQPAHLHGGSDGKAQVWKTLINNG